MKSLKYLLFIFLLTTNSLKAEIVLDKVIVNFFPDEPKQQNITVYNVGHDVAYISTEIFELLNAGMVDQKRIPIQTKNKERLVVAPKKLTINPNMKKRFQFINENQNLKEDKIYRVTVSPKVAGIKTNDKIGIKILIGYDVLVIVRPVKIKFDLKVKRTNDTISFENIGNTNILLENIKQCDDKNNCKTILSDRLYVKNKLTAKLIYKNKPVFAEMYYGDELKKEKY